MRKHAYYKRSWVFIWVPLAVILATVIGTEHTLTNAILYQKIGFNLLTGLAIWVFYYQTILWLDKRMPWLSCNRNNRWIIQLGMCITIGIALNWGGTQLRNEILGVQFSPHMFFYTDMPIMVLFSVLIHLLFYQAYISYHKNVNHDLAQQEVVSDSKASPPLLTISVKEGKTNHVIPIEDIAYFFRKDDFNFLRMWDGKELLLNQSLSSVEQSIPSHLFFRINRQLLANRKAISSYKVLKNRQTALQLSPPLDMGSLLNKNRLASFKQWLAVK